MSKTNYIIAESKLSASKLKNKDNFIDSSPKIIKPNYNYSTDKEYQLCKVSKTELTGFVPRATEIRRMYAQGELYTIMKEYEIGNMMSRSVTDIPVGLANIKNLDKVDLEKAIKQRIQHYNKLKDNVENSLKNNFQVSQRSDSEAVNTNKHVDFEKNEN